MSSDASKRAGRVVHIRLGVRPDEIENEVAKLESEGCQVLKVENADKEYAHILYRRQKLNS